MYKAIILDETEYIDAEWLKKHHVKRAGTLYVYNDTVGVHCCEMTPSHELYPVDVDVEVEHDGEVLNHLREKAWEDLREGEMWEVKYIHVHSLKNKGTPLHGDFESIEDAVEYAQGNTPCAEWF